MAFSYQNYTGDNATTQFSIPFTYQNTSEISVTVNGVAETGLTFPSSSTVQLTSAPATGAIVQVRRTTDLSARAVDFVSGSVLTEEDLDNSAIQVFHAAQESKDVVNDTITLDTDLKWEADNKVIKNVANPVNLQDAATKNYIENTWLTTSDKAQLNSLNIPNLNSVATNITDVTTVASNISDVNAFAEKYRIGATDPITSLDEGDLFYNTTDDQLKVYNGTAWETGVSGASGLLSLTGGTMTGNIAFSGSQTVDGRDVSVDGTKLDGIESGATADQTGAEIKAAYEAEASAFTDAQFTKLAGIEAGATADQTASEIRALVESASDSNVFTDADHTKLNGIATGATATKLFDESYDGTSTLPSATGTNSVAVGVEAEADSLQTSAFGFGALAKNSYSLALGTSYAGGANSTAIGIGDNSASYGVRSVAQYGIAIGHRAYSRDYASISIGYLSKTFGNNTISLGSGADAASSASVAIGYYAKADIVGKFAYSNRSNNSSNLAQGGYYILNKSTTDATPTFITTNGGSASVLNQISVLLNSATSFSGTIIARESAAAGSDYASWEIKGAMFKNGAGTCVLGNGIVNKLYATSGASTWAVSLSVDAFGSNLKIQVTGQASTSILWVATVNTSEVTYA
jgi:hypothetical protein